MKFRFGDVNVSSKKRHVITQRRAVFKVKSEYSHALLLSKFKKVQVGKDQEKVQSEKDSHSKNRGGKKPN